MQETRRNKCLDLGRQKKPQEEGTEENSTPETPTAGRLNGSRVKQSPPVTAPKPLKGVMPAATGLKRSVSAVTETEMDFTELAKQAKQKEEQLKVEKEEQKADFEVYMHRTTSKRASVEASTHQALDGATLSNFNKVLRNMAASMTTEEMND